MDSDLSAIKQLSFTRSLNPLFKPKISLYSMLGVNISSSNKIKDKFSYHDNKKNNYHLIVCNNHVQ